jgi:hypothetical protein
MSCAQPQSNLLVKNCIKPVIAENKCKGKMVKKKKRKKGGMSKKKKGTNKKKRTNNPKRKGKQKRRRNKRGEWRKWRKKNNRNSLLSKDYIDISSRLKGQNGSLIVNTELLPKYKNRNPLKKFLLIMFRVPLSNVLI